MPVFSKVLHKKMSLKGDYSKLTFSVQAIQWEAIIN